MASLFALCLKFRLVPLSGHGCLHNGIRKASLGTKEELVRSLEKPRVNLSYALSFPGGPLHAVFRFAPEKAV